MFYPYCVFLAIYTGYVNFILPESLAYQDEQIDEPIAFYYVRFSISIILFIFSIYFLGNEVYQLYKTPFCEYISSFWNYIDLVPPLMLAIINVLDIIGTNSSVQLPLYAICSVFTWFKFLYFLRIFKKTGYLIQLIIEVFNDMLTFFIILLMVILGLSSGFMMLSLNIDNPDDRFTGNFFQSVLYTYRIALGDFSTDDFDNAPKDYILLWIIFLVTSILVVIMLFNLLISIVADTFSRVLNIRN